VRFELVIGVLMAIVLAASLSASIADWIAWERARAEKWRRMSFMDKCKRRRSDGPTPCLCCKGECKG
jgi:hypothetical protein